MGRTVAWQATTWRRSRSRSGRLGVVPAVTTPVVLLALVGPGAIGLANLVSIGPALTAMRTRPASVLREE